MFTCGNCKFYKYYRVDEYAGQVGQCRYNPPVYNWNNSRDLDNFPQVRVSAWCGQWQGK